MQNCFPPERQFRGNTRETSSLVSLKLRKFSLECFVLLFAMLSSWRKGVPAKWNGDDGFALLGQQVQPLQISEHQPAIDALLGGPVARPIWIGTFHATCSRMLRIDGERVGIRSTFAILVEPDFSPPPTVCYLTSATIGPLL